MANLLVYTLDLPGDDSLKRGHVIAVLDDKYPLGDAVLNGAVFPDGSRRFLWRVLEVPGPPSAYEHLIETQIKGENVDLVPPRKWKIDLDSYETETAFFRGRPLTGTDKISSDAAQLSGKTEVVLAPAVAPILE